jgi:hypothetical protein
VFVASASRRDSALVAAPSFEQNIADDTDCKLAKSRLVLYLAHTEHTSHRARSAHGSFTKLPLRFVARRADDIAA